MEHPIFNTYQKGKEIYDKYNSLTLLLIEEIEKTEMKFKDNFRYIEDFSSYEIIYKVRLNPTFILKDAGSYTKEICLRQLPFDILRNIYLRVGE